MAKEYIFRVTPRERGNRCRVIRIGGRRTLDELHGEILKAYGLTANHLYMFSPDGEPYDRNGYYSPYDEEAEKHADEAVLDDLKLKKGDEWLYLYDFGEDRMFDVAVDGVEQEEPDLSAGGAGVRVDLLSGDDRMESILAGCGQEELQVIREILEIGEEKKPAERKAEKQLRKREAGEIVRVLRQRPELLERLVSAKGILLLMRMRKNGNISVRECVAEQKDLSVMNVLGAYVRGGTQRRCPVSDTGRGTAGGSFSGSGKKRAAGKESGEGSAPSVDPAVLSGHGGGPPV